jgi:hypothetical protein
MSVAVKQNPMSIVRISKEEARRFLLFFFGLEVLLFLVPTTGKIEGASSGFGDGVKLRLSSGHYWAIALLCGIGAVVLLIILSFFAGLLARFTRDEKSR